jgi:hypothetical protein
VTKVSTTGTANLKIQFFLDMTYIGLLDPEDEGTVILWNIRDSTPNDTALHPRRAESSATP